MIHLYTCENMIEAQQLINALAQYNIKAEVMNKNLSGALGEIPFTETWPQVWLLDQDDEYNARKILDDLKLLEKKSEHDRFCRACGEKNPGNFSSCWNCNADLDQ